MQIASQIKRLRTEMKLSQEELAEKLFVTRQSVSNWETGKCYPDVNSLILMSTLFDVSLDMLIKGDVEEMKETVSQELMGKFNRLGVVLSILFVVMVVSAIPLGLCLGWSGLAIWGLIAVITMIVAVRVEKFKKENDIQTYKEIIAFVEGKKLDEIQKQREDAKRPYQKVLLALGSGAIALIVCIIIALLIKFVF